MNYAGRPAPSAPESTLPQTAEPTDAPTDPAVRAVYDAIGEALKADAWPTTTPPMTAMNEEYRRQSGTGTCGGADYPGVAACTWGEQSASVSIAIVGDHTAVSYVPAFRELVDRSNGALRVTSLGMYGCPFLDVRIEIGVPELQEACPSRIELDMQEIAALKPQVLVITNDYVLPTRQANGQQLGAAAYTDGVARLIDRVKADVGTVVLLAPPPSGIKPADCYRADGLPKDCITTLGGQWAILGSNERKLAANIDGAWIDTRALYCKSSQCPAFAAGVPIKFDAINLTTEYAQFVADALRALFAGAGVTLG